MGLLPGTLVAVLAIAVAFLRFYDTQDFILLGFIARPQLWSTDSPWRPSWLHWLTSALSGTVEIERQTAWLKKSNEELKKSNEDYERKTEAIKKQNERLAELEFKIDGSFSKYGIYSTPAPKPKQP
ncbi:hypothetical protein PGN35_014210 [Nodosilinea sp. PGN35]